MTSPAEALARRAELVAKFRVEADRFDRKAAELRTHPEATEAAEECELVAGDYRIAADALEFGAPHFMGCSS